MLIRRVTLIQVKGVGGIQPKRPNTLEKKINWKVDILITESSIVVTGDWGLGGNELAQISKNKRE